MDLYCVHCSSKIDSNSKFCKECGKSVVIPENKIFTKFEKDPQYFSLDQSRMQKCCEIISPKDGFFLVDTSLQAICNPSHNWLGISIFHNDTPLLKIDNYNYTWVPVHNSYPYPFHWKTLLSLKNGDKISIRVLNHPQYSLKNVSDCLIVLTPLN